MAIATAAADKRRLKNRKLLAKQTNGEPDLDWNSKEDQDQGLANALNWYSANTGKKEQKNFALEYFKSNDKSIYSRLKELEDWRFITFGSLCRMMTKNAYRHEWSDSKFFENKLEELLRVYETIKAELQEKKRLEDLATKNTPKPLTIQQRIFNAASEIGAEYDYEIDLLSNENGYQSDFEAKKYLSANGVSSTVAAKVAEFFEPVAQELEDAYAGKDEQLVEGYKHLTRTNLRRFAKFVRALVDDTKQHAQSAKKPVVRRKKTISPAQVVKRVQCMTAFEELGLRSIQPAKMLDTTDIFIYNTKTKKIQVYVSDGGLMSVKGTSIVGFSLSKSQQWTLRKPEQFFKGLKIAKTTVRNAVNKLTTKPSKVNGRLNEHCIILGAF